MGGQMARRLVSEGYAVTGYDVDPVRAAQAKANGVSLAASPARVAEASDFVLSSLTDPAAVRRAYLGKDGALEAGRAGMTLIDLSTIDPDCWREVAAAARKSGVECLDAPVSGGPVEAGSGKLVFLIGGEATVLERCRPLLMTMGTMAVAAEAMVLGVKAGVDPERLFEILSTSGGRSHHFLKRMPNVLAGNFAPSFGINLSRKDLSLALALAASLEMPMPVAATIRQMYEAAHAQGLGALDMAAVTSLYEQWTGVQVRKKPSGSDPSPGR